LLATGNDEIAQLWDLRFTNWVESACKLVKRNLSMAEWTQYAGDQPYERTCPDLPPGEGAPPDAPAAEYAG
jgi:hypothetical protein